MKTILILLFTMIRITIQPQIQRDKTPDANHPHRRRLTPKYQAKRNVVKTLWIAAGFLMLMNPALPVVLIIALPTTLLSFLILDETP